jgi:hypothetical protein
VYEATSATGRRPIQPTTLGPAGHARRPRAGADAYGVGLHELLMRNAGVALTREAIHERVWGFDQSHG